MTSRPPLELRRAEQDWTIRLINKIDDEAIAFENALIARKRIRPYDEENQLPIELPLFQQTAWLSQLSGEFRLLQITDREGQPAAQVAAEIHRPRLQPWFRHASVSAFGNNAVNHEAEFAALTLLPKLLAEKDGVKKLRIQAYRPDHSDLMDFENLTRRAGYRIVDPYGVTRSLVFDMNAPVEELAAELDKKTRAKIKHNGLSKIDIRTLTDDSAIDSIREALGAAFSRTKGGKATVDFETLFKVARTRPDLVLIQGLYFNDRPNTLLAYHVALRHGDMAESLSSGSLPDPELRKLPFSYFLFWSRMQWAKSHGSTRMDMGGVTDAGPSDPLAGISQFKRRFSKKEIEIGREMELEISPMACSIFRASAKAGSLLRR